MIIFLFVCKVAYLLEDGMVPHSSRSSRLTSRGWYLGPWWQSLRTDLAAHWQPLRSPVRGSTALQCRLNSPFFLKNILMPSPAMQSAPVAKVNRNTMMSSFMIIR